MITLDQIRTLDSKVQQAVEEIESLRDENARLRDKLSAYEKKSVGTGNPYRRI